MSNKKEALNKLPDIDKNFSEWYNEIVYQAELADQAPVRGCIVIRPYGYALWENIQQALDKKIKETGHVNAAFPLLIPQSFLEKEKEHVSGFAPELAVVTHAGGKELEEALVIRPTSETIIHYFFARWIKSWRDLPMKVNQWCSVVRWEMRTRPFVRTTEIWWQEGHTAHETEEEARQEAHLMLAQYVDIIENYLAIPIVAAPKPDSERFAGADETLALESLMPDGKALQMGTSHRISQNFAKSFGMTFQNREGNLAYPHLTSWGVTTRLIGALVMSHGDQKGLVMPPAVAPIQCVIIPIFKEESKAKVMEAAQRIKAMLEHKHRVFLDADDSQTPGSKYYKWELKGVPVRIEIGPKDLEKDQAVVVDRLGLAKDFCAINTLPEVISEKLAHVQRELFVRAHERRAQQWHKREKRAEFAADLEAKGGFYQTGWCGSAECEAAIKQHKATIRCVLPSNELAECFECDKKSNRDVLVARAY